MKKVRDFLTTAGTLIGLSATGEAIDSGEHILIAIAILAVSLAALYATARKEEAKESEKKHRSHSASDCNAYPACLESIRRRA